MPTTESLPLSGPFDYLVIITMNNASLGAVIGNPSAPYLNSLANSYGVATSYASISPHKVPNYLALTGGQTFNVTTDCTPNSVQCQVPWQKANVIDIIENAGLSWKAWAEDYPILQGCTSALKSPSGGGLYNVKSFPFPYYQDINNTAARCNNLMRANSLISSSPERDDLFLRSLGGTSTATNLMWLTPNDCDAMHSCLPLNTVSTADTYLSHLVPSILNSAIFTTQKAALIITFSEGIAKAPSLTDYVPTILAGPAAKTNYRSSNQYSHYSLLRTIETAWNLPSLATNDSIAPSMTEFFASQSTLQAIVSYSPPNPAAGTTITFTGTATNGKPLYSFSWNFGDGTGNLAGGTTNPNIMTHVYHIKGSFSLHMNVTDSSGKAASISVGVSVVPVLTVSITGPSTFYAGNPTSFTATPTGGIPPYSVSWIFGDGSSSNAATQISHTYTSPGNYTISATVTESTSATATATMSVMVAAPPPSCAITSVGVSPVEIEAGYPVTIDAKTTNCVAPVAFLWSLGDGTIGTGNPVAHGYSIGGVFEVNVTVTDSQSHMVSLSTKITVAPRISVLLAKPGPIDSGLSETFAANVSGGVGIPFCNWNFGDGTSGIGCSTSDLFLSAGSFHVTAVAIDALNVTATSSVYAVVNPSPTVSVSPAFGRAMVPLNLTATASGGTQPFAFSWNFGDGTNSVATGNTNWVSHVYAVQGAYMVQVNASDSLGVLASVSLTVNITPLVTNMTAIIVGPVSASLGTTVTFSANVNGGRLPFTYTWNFGDGTADVAGGMANPNTLSKKFTSTGIYTVTVTVNDVDGRLAAATNVITILAPAKNEPPILSGVPSFETMRVGEKLVFKVVASDLDDQITTIAASNLPLSATFEPLTGEFAWTPGPGETGTYLITFTAADNGIPLASSWETLTIRVKAATNQTCQPCLTSTNSDISPYLDDAGFLGVVFGVALTPILAFARNKRKPSSSERESSDSLISWETRSEREDGDEWTLLND